MSCRVATFDPLIAVLREASGKVEKETASQGGKSTRARQNQDATVSC